jgi:hypothetical protein
LYSETDKQSWKYTNPLASKFNHDETHCWCVTIALAKLFGEILVLVYLRKRVED